MSAERTVTSYLKTLAEVAVVPTYASYLHAGRRGAVDGVAILCGRGAYQALQSNDYAASACFAVGGLVLAVINRAVDLPPSNDLWGDN